MKKFLCGSIAMLFVSGAVLAQTTTPYQVDGTGALYILKGNEGRYVQWVNAGGNEVAWVGYPTTGSNAFGMKNTLGPIILSSTTLLDIWNRTMVNQAVDDNISALIVNGNVRLSNRGQNYIVKDFATFGETMSGAATVIGNNAMANRDVNQRIDNSFPTGDGSNAMVMSYVHGTMFHVKTSGAMRPAGEQWFTVGDGTDEVMRLTPGHNVLIGTTTDDAAYKLQVKGNIKAKKVKVTSDGWADFVFAPDYRLPSLYEVEQFILQHRHLPEIPSAKDVEENGVDLGEMNKKLLQKVEEQMLYIIEMNKRLKVLEEKVGK